MSFEAQAAKVLLKCSGATTCYYTFFIGSSTKNWTLPGGEAYSYNGVTVGDAFCHSADAPNDLNTCKRVVLTPAMLSD